jgi:hypothetical protein
MTSYNTPHAELAQWLPLARDLMGARSLRAVLGYLFMPPDWTPRRLPDSAAEPGERVQRARP